MANEIAIITEEDIRNKIYVIRGMEVMLDSDLAKLYHVETKRINEAVKNNPKKFPERFAFRISETEYNSLKSKISTSKGGSRKGHTVFTEQDVAMLSSVLKTERANVMSVNIIRAFVTMKHMIKDNINYQKECLSVRFFFKRSR